MIKYFIYLFVVISIEKRVGNQKLIKGFARVLPFSFCRLPLKEFLAASSTLT